MRGGHILICGTGMIPAGPALRTDIAAAFGDEPSLAHRIGLLGVRCDMESVYAGADVVVSPPDPEAIAPAWPMPSAAAPNSPPPRPAPARSDEFRPPARSSWV